MAKKNRPGNFASPSQPSNSKPPKPETESSAQPSSSTQPSPSAPPTTPSSNATEQPPPEFHSLPDLTRGIPSTLEFENAGSTKKSEQSALEAAEEPEQTEGGSGRTKGELPASAYMSSSEKKRIRLANRMYVAALVGAIMGVAYLGRDWDEEEAAAHKDISNGWSVSLWWQRAVARLTDVTEYYREPAFEKLLPDPHPMFERPYTLCISLEDMLVHSEWTREHGWRVAKRPGVDFFLQYLSQYYELVLFTSVSINMGEPIIRKLDPFQFINWPLFREATKYKDGEIVKASTMPASKLWCSSLTSSPTGFVLFKP